MPADEPIQNTSGSAHGSAEHRAVLGLRRAGLLVPVCVEVCAALESVQLVTESGRNEMKEESGQDKHILEVKASVGCPVVRS